MSSSDSLTPKTHPYKQRYDSNQSYSPSKAIKPVIVNCVPKLVAIALWSQRPSAPTDCHLTHDSLGNPWEVGPIRARNQNSNSTSSAVLHIWPQSAPILYNGTPLPNSKCSFPWGIWSLDTHVIYGSLGPSDSSTDTASRSVQPFCGVTNVRDRQTDPVTDGVHHATRSVTIGRMRPNIKGSPPLVISVFYVYPSFAVVLNVGKIYF